MNLRLKFKILEEFGSQSKFARECGRNDCWISRIVTGRQCPTEQEKQLISKKLKIGNIDNLLDSDECSALANQSPREMGTTVPKP